ncbi:unnamed protein product [Nippostrongylus brasiliensis]|uniref:Flagellar protein FlgN n=1 Tax=Nippostrongylus brasiliensis TaxID=27835 RepID=A0A158R3L5_NIPBR|nr:unnamed protein product [Nippostrongylus brasiliensis]
MTMGTESPVAWSDALEKDFDKAFVALDLLLGEIDSDQEVALLRRDLTEARADRDAMEKEMQQLMLQDTQLGQLHDVLMPSLRTECELDILRKECERQRNLIGALETEVFGARLAAKYLDKVRNEPLPRRCSN